MPSLQGTANFTGMMKPAGIFIAVFLLLLFFFHSLKAQTGHYDAYMDSVKADLLIQAQQVLFNDGFETADSLCRAFITRYPSDPAGYFFKAAVLLAEMSDREENLYPEQFHRLLDTAANLAEKMTNHPDRRYRAWMYLFSGHVRAYRSLWEARFGSMLAAVNAAFKARSEYEKGLENDSTLVDLYLGLGSYHYWKSARAGIFRWLGILKNQKDQGLEELYRAYQGSIISRESARSAMLWVWLDLKEYDSVVALAHEALLKYPGGKSFRWPLARAYFEKKDYSKALQTYQDLRNGIASNPGNYYNLIECDYYLNQCYDRMQMNEEAHQAARHMKKYYDKIPGDVRQRQRDNIAYLKRVART
ncbi:MAG: hypothetical protein PHU88_10845 [candidate division Zixibacteria bacterium]|nr:hypothetical protein [candidate division Zixibacteria bacterium]